MEDQAEIRNKVNGYLESIKCPADIYQLFKNLNYLQECILDPSYTKKIKVVGFDQFRSLAGSNSFVLSPKKWGENNKNKKGNIRDYANVSRLVCLSNLENLNALFIDEELSQNKRLIKLNKIAIRQMKLLIENKNVKKLESKAK